MENDKSVPSPLQHSITWPSFSARVGVWCLIERDARQSQKTPFKLSEWCVTGLSLPASILLLLWMHEAPCSMMTHCLRLVLISCANPPWLVDEREIFQDCFWSSASPKGMYMEHQVFCIKALLADLLLTEKQLMCTSYLMASSSQLRSLGVFQVLFSDLQPTIVQTFWTCFLKMGVNRLPAAVSPSLCYLFVEYDHHCYHHSTGVLL